MTFTGLPESASSAPALAANAIGMSRRDGRSDVRRAASTATGRSAAAAPLGVTNAASTAASSMIAAVRSARPRPVRRTSS